MCELCRERKGGIGTSVYLARNYCTVHDETPLRIGHGDNSVIRHGENSAINLIQNHVNRTIGLYTNNPIKQQPSMVP